MTILGGKSLEHIPLFLANIDEATRIKVIEKYEEVLKYFYKSKRIVEWFKNNLTRLKPRHVIAVK